ncbi:hypothetical protein MNEG_0345 [Monoraphidium neglectum]|uniref:Uncharacterized protein n=1 Tax=Monoraphidium neglectum TaxID=145388 RepID=A0A0D2KBV5_9CHLO|nr:hypothetical protein MNEG_0345 [Monoraphidium neglectum]KIZ07598.1 hypothetical protein MNEG_0345 [Monoraphidium neglectum]|eukprot:XP_013906617.1 hypothetical protein MNEG_0345 [Monoraphidium neglectum]
MRRGRWNEISNEVEEAREKLAAQFDQDLTWRLARERRRGRDALAELAAAAEAAAEGAAGLEAARAVVEALRRLQGRLLPAVVEGEGAADGGGER